MENLLIKNTLPLLLCFRYFCHVNALEEKKNLIFLTGRILLWSLEKRNVRSLNPLRNHSALEMRQTLPSHLSPLQNPTEKNKWSLKGWVDGTLQRFSFLHKVLKLEVHFRGKVGRRKGVRGVRQENGMSIRNL